MSIAPTNFQPVNRHEIVVEDLVEKLRVEKWVWKFFYP